jgi:two-component system LytT family response regulator
MNSPRRIRTMVVDDEPIARLALRVLLERDPEIELLADADAVAAERRVPLERPELLFLDVHMPGLDGFELLERIGVENVPAVVFVTGWDRHARRAFDVGAVDYLLKPFDDERFALTLARVKRRLAGPASPADRVQRLMARAGDRLTMVDLAHVDWIEAADYYVCLHVGSATHLVRRTMAGLERQLDATRFFRVHRSAIVNLERVREVRPDGHGEPVAVLEGGGTLRVGRGRLESLKRRLAGEANPAGDPAGGRA